MKALGNPFSTLGANGFLNKTQIEELKKVYSGNLRALLSQLLKGGPPSFLYSSPSILLSLEGLASTLLPLGLGYSLAMAFSIAWLIFIGPKVPKAIRSASFIPEFIYAIPLALTSWSFGWPPPLLGTSFQKALAYSLVILLGEWPKLVYGFSGLVEDQRGVLRDTTLLLKAIGLSDFKIRVKELRVLLPSLTSFSITNFVNALERSVFVEPLISYMGIGYLLFSAVTGGDPPLASSAFLIIATLSYLGSYLADELARRLDPRTR
ncbi:hypothetical protein IPA_07485 [Ignicoccus pacificus DSM 13166]|uniref:ABC transmembrane type-1 domain-containing protein n=1 Tax=Ignicoccus pacificus DSM 13166 TaxID=940294 RepID=A0A977KBM0_9CREN|nr:hypothetical protein IPA_07485 [Ignicoccus pacificus DSM 13166]